jgi:N-acetylglucosamine kinase-like BadF-type ATPase
MSSLHICLDCGGTKASAVVVDAKTKSVVGRGLGGPANVTDVGLEGFLKAVKDASEIALSGASKNRERISLPADEPLIKSVWIGASGVDKPSDVERLEPHIAKLFTLPREAVTVANDAHLLAAPLQKHEDCDHAIVIIAGTGSICMAFGLEGEEKKLVEVGRAGGWGWILGDEGSGFYIGRKTVRKLLEDWDVKNLTGVHPNEEGKARFNGTMDAPYLTLEEHILRHFGITTPPEILDIVFAADPAPQLTPPSTPDNIPTVPAISPLSVTEEPKTPFYLLKERKHRLTALAPIVFHSAFAESDPTALYVLKSAAFDLAEHVSWLFRSPKIKAEKTVLCFGGSLVGVKAYRDVMVECLKEMGYNFPYVEYVDNAAESGAMALVGK